MKTQTCCKCQNRERSRVLFAIFTFVAVSIGMVATQAVKCEPSYSPIVKKCRADLAKRIKMPEQLINIVSTQPKTWRDSSLGMPEAGKMYAQVITPGNKAVLNSGGVHYLYVTSANAIKYGGPVALWGSSILTLKPIPNDPNLNQDLYQTSLMGSNSSLVCSGVSQFYPQYNGGIIVTRRTSRSGFTMIYVRAGSYAKPVELLSAFSFGDAVMNAKQTEWAAFMRPGLGAALTLGPASKTMWKVVIGKLGVKGKTQRLLEVPEDARPGKIAWVGDKLMITTGSGKYGKCYELSPKETGSDWKVIPSYLFPGSNKMMLNKSESLEVSSINEGGKPGAEVATIWFTGDKKVVAAIKDFTLRGYELTGNGYVVLWGVKDETHVAYTVSIHSGMVIPYAGDLGEITKLYNSPPKNSPLSKG